MGQPPPKILRPAEEQDRALAYEIRKRAFEPQLGVWDEAHEREVHDRRFDTYPYRILLRNGAEVGVLVTDVTDESLHLHQLFVLPEYQGAGLGTACLEIVLREAEALGRPVRLRVLHGNVRARAFFERQGFAATGETTSHTLLARAAQR